VLLEATPFFISKPYLISYSIMIQLITLKNA
jgi:hypothetical protein